MRATLGEACYKRLAKHSKNLQPAELFDENWLEREFLHATVMGVVQFPHLKNLQPLFKPLTFLPTRALIKVLHRMDDVFGDGEAWKFAQASGATAVGPEEIQAGLHNWHTWRYQECAEIGGFLTSEKPDGLFTRTREDFCAECRAQFGEEPRAAAGPDWSQREMVEKLTVPLVYVTGGMDPWLSVSLEPEYEIKETPEGVKYIVEPDKIVGGGPPKDGIPSIDHPKFVSPEEADEWIKDDELVLAFTYKGETRVYPLQIMVWHEIVNDFIAGYPALVTY